MPDTTPVPDFEPEPGDSAESESDPRIEERPPPEDFGIPGINLDKYGRFQVPKLKADYCLLEQAHQEFYLGMGLDVPLPIDWIWSDRIPIGKLTLIEGEGGSGTSFVVADLAARVSRGSLTRENIPLSQPASSQPTGSQPTGSEPAISATTSSPPTFGQQDRHVLFVNGGDNLHDTLTPRLINMQAHLYDVTILSGVDAHDPAEMRAGKADTRRWMSLPADLGHIEYQLRQRPDTRLVVVDSLSDFCHTERQFRETLRGLHEIAERCHVAVVATARPKNWHSARNKLKPSADRRSESVRCVLNVLVDPHDPSQRYLAPARMNFCREPQWLPFRIGDGKVEWGEPLAAAPVYSRLSPAAQEKITLLQEAVVCLYDTLATGDMPAKTALKQVMECGFSKATVVRARRELGVRSYREGWGSRGWWTWSIKPAGEGQAAGETGAPESGADVSLPEPTDEFRGPNFERMYQAAVLDTLNQERAAELATMGPSLANGQPESNGKKGKNGKRKPR